MTPEEFADLHQPALEADEVRHNLILGMLTRAREGRLPELRSWSFGPPGRCALQTAPQYPVIIGALTADECRRFAELTLGSDYLGVIGPDATAEAFAARAASGIAETDDGRFSVHFGPVYLGYLDHRSTLIREPTTPDVNPTPPR